MVREYPLPAPYTSCESGCPENAFFVLDSEPEFVDSVIRPLRDAPHGVLLPRGHGAPRAAGGPVHAG